MRKIKSLLTFIAIVIMVSACEFSPEEIQPVGDIKLENYTGTSGNKPEPAPKPEPID